MAPEHICLMIPDLKAGGTERQCQYLANGLRRRFSVSVISFFSGGSIEQELSSTEGIRLERSPRHSGTDLLHPLRTADLLKDLHPDVVQTFLPLANVTGLISGKLAEVPRIYTGLRMSGGNVAEKTHSFYGWLDRWLGNRLASGMVCNAERGKLDYERTGYRSDRLHVIPNGIDVERVQEQASEPAEVRLNPDEERVGMFARLAPMKDPQMFLRLLRYAMERRPGIRGYVAGAGTDQQKEQLRSAIHDLDLEDEVHYLGKLENPYPVMNQMDAVVSSSRYGEGMSNTIMESLALGVPVVATDVGDAGALVQDGRTGYLVPPSSPREGGRALLQLLKERDRYRQMKKGAREHIKSFSKEKMVERYVDLYLNHHS